MIETNAAVFFENQEDFLVHCKKDPFTREYKYNMRFIKYPYYFPAAYKYEPDFDSHFAGNYKEIPFDEAINTALQNLKTIIRDAELQISQLNCLTTAIKDDKSKD